MTKQMKINAILAGVVLVTACGGANSVNNAPPNGVATGNASATTTTAGDAAAPAATAGVAPNASTPASTGGGLTTPSAGATVSAPALPVYREVSLPVGTKLPLELLTSVSSETSTVESPVRARLRQDVVVDGITAIPSGTELTGVVTESDRAGRVKGLSRIAFRFTRAEVRGTEERVRTNSLVFVGEESTKGDAARIGGGAVAGAVIGGLLGGGKGAAEGAAIGGGAGTGVVLATRGKDVRVASGASVTATLADPLTLQIPR